ncbi:FKBP-type peptidyl-prolyl cis-trans isomerase [Flavobacterium poyangense]|uniref:FKBP-type peptidyl-prolyl cis-trans isomerase n=1 Tax=Flavobacterium poyangense TaxID=2204302 RepID=UPI00141F469D|nr:FKBP-type peptidyl-prolyl cis-trans isomerase [Flavobacterium sp. JXAS1]
MTKIKYYFILLLAGVAIVSCNKNDDNDVETVPLRDYNVQYKADTDSIMKYLKTNYIESVSADFDIKISKIPAGGTQVSIWDQKVYPLQERKVYSNGVDYVVYYLSLRKGTGISPTNYDKISASYSGNTLNGKVFDTSHNVPRDFSLEPYLLGSVIEGWSEIFPQFKMGTVTKATDGSGTIKYEDFGAGVMFLPSGLAYYGSGQTSIPAYSCLVFSFKLVGVQRLDHDFDGILDVDEDINGDGYLYDVRNTTKYPNPPKEWLEDDTDKDGLADFIDVDDDGDGFSTFLEITKPADQVGIVKQPDGSFFNFGISKTYPFHAPVLDNPETPNVDETEPRGIPAFAATGEPDYTTPTRLRIHLDKAHHKPKP